MERKVHRIEDDIAEVRNEDNELVAAWIVDEAKTGMESIERFLANHAAFAEEFPEDAPEGQPQISEF